jgi:hypothetical protein
MDFDFDLFCEDEGPRSLAGQRRKGQNGMMAFGYNI